MVKLSDLIRETGRGPIIISGPYGTEIAERMAEDTASNPQKASGVPNNKYMGAGCSALLTPEGQEYVREVALDYLSSLPKDQASILVTDSFRLEKQILEAAATIRGFDPQLPSMGLELCLDSIDLAREAIERSGRSRDNTVIAMSIGPPFDCYKGEATPSDINSKYLPQTFAAVRFGSELDYLMFETVPSLRAAIGAAEAFKQAHAALGIDESKSNFARMGTITYMGAFLRNAIRFGSVARLVPSYDPTTNTFREIQPEKEYVISLCLEADGTLNGVGLNNAITTLYSMIEQENLYTPIGLGINCNSPAVTRRALQSLSPENRKRIIGIYPNASSEANPRNYASMTHLQAIPRGDFARQVGNLVTDYNLKIVGGCCGTDSETMSALAQLKKSNF